MQASSESIAIGWRARTRFKVWLSHNDLQTFQVDRADRHSAITAIFASVFR